jgi:hypothetical protein
MLAKITPQDCESLDEAEDISHIFDFIDELLLQQQKLKQHFSKVTDNWIRIPQQLSLSDLGIHAIGSIKIHIGPISSW